MEVECDEIVKKERDIQKMPSKIEKDKLIIDSTSNGYFYVGLNVFSTHYHFGSFTTMEDLDYFLELLISELCQITERTMNDLQRLVRETRSKAHLKIYGDVKKRCIHKI